MGRGPNGRNRIVRDSESGRASVPKSLAFNSRPLVLARFRSALKFRKQPFGMPFQTKHIAGRHGGGVPYGAVYSEWPFRLPTKGRSGEAAASPPFITGCARGGFQRTSLPAIQLVSPGRLNMSDHRGSLNCRPAAFKPDRGAGRPERMVPARMGCREAR